MGGWATPRARTRGRLPPGASQLAKFRKILHDQPEFQEIKIRFFPLFFPLNKHGPAAVPTAGQAGLGQEYRAQPSADRLSGQSLHSAAVSPSRCPGRPVSPGFNGRAVPRVPACGSRGARLAGVDLLSGISQHPVTFPTVCHALRGASGQPLARMAAVLAQHPPASSHCSPPP